MKEKMLCACCGKTLPYLPTPEYQFFIQRNRETWWFCNSACIIEWKQKNPDKIDM